MNFSYSQSWHSGEGLEGFQPSKKQQNYGQAENAQAITQAVVKQNWTK